MVVKIDVTGDASKIVRDLGFRLPKIQEKSEITAINKTIDRLYTKVRRDIRQETGVPAKKQNVRKYKADRHRRSGAIWMGFKSKPSVASLIRRKNYTGSGKFAKWVEPVHKPGKTFTSRMPSGHTGFFRRRGRARLPIKELRVNLTKPGTAIINRVSPGFIKREFPRQFLYDFKRRTRKRAA